MAILCWLCPQPFPSTADTLPALRYTKIRRFARRSRETPARVTPLMYEDGRHDARRPDESRRGERFLHTPRNDGLRRRRGVSRRERALVDRAVAARLSPRSSGGESAQSAAEPVPGECRIPPIEVLRRSPDEHGGVPRAQ